MSSTLAQRTVPPRSERDRRIRRGVWVGTRLAGAVLLGGSAVVHLHLWMIGYRQVPTIGPLFLAQAVVGFLLAGLVVVTSRPMVVFGAITFLLCTMGGLILSATVGLFGFHDGLDAPQATLSLILEGVAVTLLALSLRARLTETHG